MLKSSFAPGEKVTLDILKARGLVRADAVGYKVLVREFEKMDRPLTIYATSFSEKAKAEIIAAGGRPIKV
jgi:ribosomal protein L15